MFGICINDKDALFSLKIALGLKTLETRNVRSLDRYTADKVGRVAIIQTGKGKANIVGYCEIEPEPLVVDTIDRWKQLANEHMVPAGSRYYFADKPKFCYKIKNPEFCIQSLPAEAELIGRVAYEFCEVGA